MTLEDDIFEFIDKHPRCTRTDIQYGLGLSASEVNTGLLFLSAYEKISYNKFEFPNRFLTER